MEALNCPNCRAPLSNDIVGGKTECAYCGSVILVGTEGNEIKDTNTGLVIATAECPKGYKLSGLLSENFQSSCYPITTYIYCENKRKNVLFFRESGKAFQQVLKHMLFQHQEGQMETNYQIPMFMFRSVEEYLDVYAFNYANGKNIKYEKQMEVMPVNFVDTSIPRAIQVEMELQAARLSYGVENNYGKSITRLYKLEDEYLLLSSTVFGIRWYVNAPNMMMPSFDQMAEFGKMLSNGIKGLFGNSNSNNDPTPVSNVVQDNSSIENIMRSPVNGKVVSFTNWWVPCIYGIQMKKLPDEETLKNFSLFCSTVKETTNVLERRNQISSQLINNMYVASQQEFARSDAFVANAQADIHRRQAQISQTLQQSSNIIMEGYENRRSMQDRTSRNYSEAIRGVDTYMGSNGPTEFKTGAKRVVQKNNDPKQMVEIGYLDTVPNGWSEIFKQ